MDEGGGPVPVARRSPHDHAGPDHATRPIPRVLRSRPAPVTILITGGAGYVGSHVLKALRADGVPCVVLDNLSRGHREHVLDADLVVGEVADVPLVRRVIGDYRVTAVMHFAAYAYVGESVADPLRYYTNNVTATVNLLTAMVEGGVGTMVFSSTCATYGVPDAIPITEDHPQRPINPYGTTKMIVERVLRDVGEAQGLRSVALRYFNAAGADPSATIGEWHAPETHLIPLALAAAAGHRDGVEIYGTDYPTSDGTCVRDYIHVVDLARPTFSGCDTWTPATPRPSSIWATATGSRCAKSSRPWRRSLDGRSRRPWPPVAPVIPPSLWAAPTRRGVFSAGPLDSTPSRRSSRPRGRGTGHGGGCRERDGPAGRWPAGSRWYDSPRS